MSACCVSGCKNRHSAACKLKFYRIPSSKIPFQANRRRLWLEVIGRVNGGARRLGGNARVCGAHFASGQASMDHRSVDFVPSVFPSPKPAPGSGRRGRRLFGQRKRRCPGQTARVEGEESPPGDAHQSSVVLRPRNKLSEAVQIPEDAQKADKTTKAGETETATEATKPEATSSGAKMISSVKLPAGVTAPSATSPVVLLKPLVTPAGGFRCELCDQTFAAVPQFLKHRRRHEEKRPVARGSVEMASASRRDAPAAAEPLPCNMCDRSFTSAHNLKRHKLLHLRDGRKCPQCGVLFCRRHNHVLFLPRPESAAGGEEPPALKHQDVGGGTQLGEARPGRTEEAKSSGASTPATAELKVPSAASASASALPVVGRETQIHRQKVDAYRFPLPASFASVLTEIPVPAPRRSRPPRPPQSKPPNHPADFLQPHLPVWPKLPPSLQVFTPQRLTSALLEVHRNYDYILGKSAGVHNKEEVKEEPPGTPGRSPELPRVRPERTAYDLEVVL